MISFRFFTRVKKRCRQFFRALFCKMGPADRDIVRKYLDSKEELLFNRMDTAIQKHCVNVAVSVLELSSTRPVSDLQVAVKAALLHDIGKSCGRYSVWDRVWFVLIRTTAPGLAGFLAKSGRSSCPERLGNAFYIHTNHQQIGASLTEQAGLEEKITFLVRNHHDKSLSADCEELELLIRADELN